MNFWLVAASLLTLGVLAGAQTDSAGVVHVDPAKVAAAPSAKGPPPGRPALFVRGRHPPRARLQGSKKEEKGN